MASRRPHALVLLLLLLCAVGLGFGTTLPTVSFHRAGADVEIYSILTGVGMMWNDGNWIMASIIFLFSVVFPAAKLLLLGAILTERGDPILRARVTSFLDRYGKWSMLDVFIVAAFVGSIRLGLIAHADSNVGIHVFAATVLASMVCCHLVVRLQGSSGHGTVSLRRGGAAGRCISTASVVALGAGWFLPLLDVRKAFVFRNDFVLYGSTGTLLTHGEVLLACAIAVFVLGIPTLRALLLLRFRWWPSETCRGARLALALGAWAMLDVFALGIGIVLIKLDELATARAMTGLYLVLAAGVLAWLDGWLLTREGAGSSTRDPSRSVL
jgi:paraquat-inducible protein A